jgi:nucleoside diphosphate kinase
LLFDIGAFNFFTDGYANFENNFNGIKELYQRSNSPAIIYSYYRQLNLEYASFYSTNSFIFRVSVVEYMLSAPSVISKYSVSQRREVATELLSKLNIKKSQPGNFPINYQNSTYRALFKIIRCDEAGKLSSDDARIAGYFTGIGAAPEGIMKQVEEIIRQYFSGK